MNDSEVRKNVREYHTFLVEWKAEIQKEIEGLGITHDTKGVNRFNLEQQMLAPLARAMATVTTCLTEYQKRFPWLTDQGRDDLVLVLYVRPVSRKSELPVRAELHAPNGGVAAETERIYSVRQQACLLALVDLGLNKDHSTTDVFSWINRNLPEYAGYTRETLDRLLHASGGIVVRTKGPRRVYWRIDACEVRRVSI